MIDFENVTKIYEAGNHALEGITMHIDDGEFVFLVGPSGSGKSTIIKLLTAELSPTSGSISVNGYQLEKIKRRKRREFIQAKIKEERVERYKQKARNKED